MKNKRRIIWGILAAVLLLGCAAAYALTTMPLKYYDEQGVQIAAHLRSKNFEAYYSAHRYLSLSGWQKGTDISVYGLHAKDQFVEIANEIKNQNPVTNIWVTFYSGTHDEQNVILRKLKISE